MTNPDGVLDAIDSALRDYTVSPDAMRCAPDGPEGECDDNLAVQRVRETLHVALRSPYPLGPPCCAGCVPYSGQPHSCEIATRRYWSPELRRWAVWPEGACPECGSGVIEGQHRPVHGDWEGPWRYRYSCGHELYRAPSFPAPPVPAGPEGT